MEIKKIIIFQILEWCTGSYNVLHANQNGLKCNKGENNSYSKNNNKIIKEIRDHYLHYPNTPLKEMAKKYNLHVSCISSIKNKKSWKHI